MQHDPAPSTPDGRRRYGGKQSLVGHAWMRRRCTAFDLPTFSPYLHILIIQRSKNAALDVRRSLVAIFHRERVARVRSNGHLLEALSIRYSAMNELMSKDDDAVSISMSAFAPDHQESSVGPLLTHNRIIAVSRSNQLADCSQQHQSSVCNLQL